MSVHYKFKTCLNYDKVTFDGVHISVGDLKKAIMQQKKIGKSADFDLQITNQQTKEVYDNDDLLIPKNTTVIVARIPVTGSKKHWERNEQSSSSNNSPAHIALEKIIKSSDLSSSNASEEEKIKQMMSQSTQDYDSSKFVKSRGMVGPLPPNYTCYRCGQPGHYIKHCPTNNMEIKRSTGIPRSFMKPASADQKGALLTPSGEYAVPIIDHEAYKEVKKEKPPFLSNNETEVNETTAEIPENLQCMLCRDLLQDAVLIHCCGNSYCDECIRTNLLESEQHECPTCNTTGISPDTLIPNRFLRNAVLKFKNETGYSKPKRDDLVCEQNVSIKDSCNGSVLQAVVDDKLSIETVSKYNETSEVQVKTDALQDDENDKKPSLEISNQGEYQTVNENEKETAQKPNSEMVETKTEMTEQPENENNLQELKPETSINVESAESEKIETSNEVVEEYNDSTNNECSSATNNKNIKTMSIRNVIRPVTSIMQQGIAMHRAPILPHPPRMFHRPGIPHDPRFYRTPMRDPHGYSLAMGPGPGPYGYGGAHMRPHSYPDPYGFMGHRPPHMHSTQFPRPHLLGHPQNYNEPPPPGSSPHNVLGESNYSHYSTAISSDYEDPLDKFAKQLQSKSRRKRISRSRSRSKSRGRTRSRSRPRRSRSRSRPRRSRSRGEADRDSMDKFSKQSQSKSRRKRISRSRSKSRTRSRSRSRTRRSRSRGEVEKDKERKDKYDKHRHYHRSKHDPKDDEKVESRIKKERKESTDDESKKKHKHKKHKHHSDTSSSKSKKTSSKEEEKSKSKDQQKSSKRKKSV